jgi:NAD(P)H-dependent FMN reductase
MIVPPIRHTIHNVVNEKIVTAPLTHADVRTSKVETSFVFERTKNVRPFARLVLSDPGEFIVKDPRLALAQGDRQCHVRRRRESPAKVSGPHQRILVAKPVLNVIIGSTRPGRVGPAIAKWFYDIAEAEGTFDVVLVDLVDFDLPIFNEPRHPVLGQYEFEHTKRWSAAIARADAFVFVIPEYNHSFNAATKNAIDYLNHEWKHKPVGIVSYGSMAMGVRAVQALKPIFAVLRLVFSGEVTIPLPLVPIVDGVFSGDEVLNNGAKGIMRELAIMSPPLKELRESGAF